MTDTTRPFFTAIIPTYNRPALLAEAVGSVVRQSCPDWELIVVDDASPEPVAVPQDKRIRLLRNETNLGKSASINRALALARGRVIAFLDDDDAWARDRLANAKVAHESGADVVVCGTGSIANLHDPRSASSTVPRIEARLSHPMAATSVVATKCPEFEVTFRACEDLEWAIRVQRQRPTIQAVQSADFLWRVHTGERHLNGIAARIWGHRQLLEKHSEYYTEHPAERAERLHHIGLLYYRYGLRGRALRFAVSSLTVRPTVGAAELVLRVALPQNVNWANLSILLKQGVRCGQGRSLIGAQQ